MAKFDEAHDGIVEMFNEVLNDTVIERMGIKIKILVNNNLKTVTDIKKSTPLLKHETGNDFYLFVNETIFDQLEMANSRFPRMVLEEELAKVAYDSEKDVISLVRPEVNTFKSILKKYTYENYEILQESIKTLFLAEKEKNKK
jgi:hypothetical protein